MTRARSEGEVISHSPAFRSAEEKAECAARCDAKVLLTGESGSGKEVMARLIHRQSSRHDGPFVAINCAGLPDTLLESELFGHERGSFTGAYRDKPGLLESADRGTVLLDEVEEMSSRMQGLLLRFLETGELQRVGGNGLHRRVDVRVIAATNGDLVERVAAGTFRQDLFYRLNVIHIPVPPLRERREDILPLMEHFLSTFASAAGVPVPCISDEARAVLEAHHWPGNVRELRNVAERLIVRNQVTVTESALGLLAPLRRPRPLAVQPSSAAETLYERMVHQGESFWGTVYVAFMSHDMTREELRAIVKRGLAETGGNYKQLVRLFNMGTDSDRRFLSFLRKHQCHMSWLPQRDPASRPAESSFASRAS
jgi:transcriptional regulator with PAS, ATPase and Fis domain